MNNDNAFLKICYKLIDFCENIVLWEMYDFRESPLMPKKKWNVYRYFDRPPRTLKLKGLVLENFSGSIRGPVRLAKKAESNMWNIYVVGPFCYETFLLKTILFFLNSQKIEK